MLLSRHHQELFLPGGFDSLNDRMLDGSTFIDQKYRLKLVYLLRFPENIINSGIHSKESLDPKKFSFSPILKSGWIEPFTNPRPYRYYIGYSDGSMGLLLWYDEKPLCIVSYEETPDAIFIKQIQALPVETSLESKCRDEYHKKGKPYRGSNNNFILSDFDWKKALVQTMEEIAQIRGKSLILILPAEANKVYTKERADQLEKIYNDTAKILGYKQFVCDDLGEVGVFFKELQKPSPGLTFLPDDWKQQFSRKILTKHI